MSEEWNREEDWFWEGNVMSRVVDFMRDSQGFTLLSSDRPGPSEEGLQIVAEQQVDAALVHKLVNVRGWPSQLYTRGPQAGQQRATRPEVIARGWMAQLAFDLCLLRGADPDLDLAVALPTMAGYIRYLQRLRWFMAVARVTVYLVSQDGRVSITPPGAAPVNVFAAPSLAQGQVAPGKRRKLGLPGASRLQLPLLHALIVAGGTLSRAECIKAVSRWFPEVPQPPPSEFGQRLSIAQNTSQEEGLAAPAGRGTWQITPEGRQAHDAQWQGWLAREGRG